MNSQTYNTKGAAYREAKASGRIESQASRIMPCFSAPSDSWSREELSELLSIKVSSICGAAADLLKKGRLQVVGVGIADSGAKVQLLGLPRT